MRIGQGLVSGNKSRIPPRKIIGVLHRIGSRNVAFLQLAREIKLAGNAGVVRIYDVLCSVVCSACFGQVPPNDNFTNATVLDGSSTTFSGALSNATFEPGETPAGCNIRNQ